MSFRRPATLGLWVQAELVAMATALADVSAGALALQLLFDVPLLATTAAAAVVAAVVIALNAVLLLGAG